MTERIEISRRLVIVNAASGFLRQLLGLTVLLWVQRHLHGELTEAEFALYPILMAFMAFVPVITAVLTTGLGRFVTEAYARGDTRRVSELTSTMFPVLVVAALMLLAVGVWLVGHVETVFNLDASDPESLQRQILDARVMLGMLFASSAVQLASAPFGLGFYLRQRFVVRNLIGLGCELGRITILMVLLYGVSMSVRWVVVATVSAGLVELLIVQIMSRRMVPALTFRPGLVRLANLRVLTEYGGWTVLSRLAGLIRESSDRLLLSEFATKADVNAHYFGTFLDVNYRRVVFGATGVAQPALTALHATGQDERLRATYERLSTWFLTLLILAGVPLAIFRLEFMTLYLSGKPDVVPAATAVLGLMALRGLFLFPNAAIGALAVARAEVKPLAIRALSIELVNLALTLYLVIERGLGARGAALSTFVVTAVLYPPLFWTLGARLSGLRVGVWWRAVAPRAMLAGALGGACHLAMGKMVPATTWGTLALDVGVGCAVIAALSVRFVLAPEDRDRLFRMLRSLRLAGAPDER